MRFFIENEKGRALCHSCGGPVATTFKRRDVPFSDSKGFAQNILVGVCDQCDQVVVIPAQSTPAIRDARHKGVKPIEASLPAIYLDVLDLAAFTVDNRASTDFRRYLLSYFVHKTAQQEEQLERVVERYEMAIRLFPEKRGVARRRLSLKVPQAVSDDLRLLCESSHLNTSNVIKSVVFDIQSQIIESPKQPLLKELRSFAAVLG